MGCLIKEKENKVNIGFLAPARKKHAVRFQTPETRLSAAVFPDHSQLVAWNSEGAWMRQEGFV